MHSTKEDAHKLVNTFAAESSKGAFVHISRTDLAQGLHKRIDDPSIMDQNPSSLCGSASLLYTLACSDPVAYAQLVIDLYSKGTAHLGKRDIKPGSDLKNYDPKGAMNPADWVPMASIRDSANWVMDYESVDDQVAGITFPGTLEKTLKDIGYRDVEDHTNLVFHKSGSNLLNAENLRNAAKDNSSDAWWVFLFINAQILESSTPSKYTWSPNHWVILLDSHILPDLVHLEVFSWGKKLTIPRSGTLSLNTFLGSYYGYIKCRY